MRKLLALVTVLVGLGGYFLSAPKGVSSDQKAACEAALDKRGGSAPSISELKKQCNDVGMVAMMQAQGQNESAQDAAKRISAANQAEVGANGLQMFFLGLSLVGFLGLLFSFFKKKSL